MERIISRKMGRALLIISFGIITVFILHHTFIYLLPFFIAIMIALLLDPLVSYIETKTNRSREFAASIMMISFTGLFLSISYFILAKGIKELFHLIDHIPKLIQHLKFIFLSIGQTIYQNINTFIPHISGWNFEQQLDQVLERLNAYSIDVLQNIIQFSTGALGSLSYSMFVIVFIMLAIYMLIKDMELFKQQTRKIIPKKIRYYFAPVLMHVKKALFGLLKAQMIITVISSVMFLIGLLFLQIDYAVAITLTIFFIDFIPYVGLGLFLIPWIGYLFLTGQYILTIEITVLYILVIIVRQILEPKLIARSIGIHPFIALSILFVGFQTMGLIGIIITPFILIIVSAFHQAGVFHAIWRYIND